MAEDINFMDMEAPAEEMPAEMEAGEDMEEAEDIGETLSMFKPEDILKWMVDQGMLAPETQLVNQTSPVEGGGETGSDMGAGISFSDMLA